MLCTYDLDNRIQTLRTKYKKGKRVKSRRILLRGSFVKLWWHLPFFLIFLRSLNMSPTLVPSKRKASQMWRYVLTGMVSTKMHRNQLSENRVGSTPWELRWAESLGSFSLSISLRTSWSTWAPISWESRLKRDQRNARAVVIFLPALFLTWNTLVALNALLWKQGTKMRPLRAWTKEQWLLFGWTPEIINVVN